MLTDEMIARKIVSDQNNGFPLCPRCGRQMPDPVTRGALSRHADGVYICEMCGTDEALRDNTLPLSSWKPVRSRGYMHDESDTAVATRLFRNTLSLRPVGTDCFGREVFVDELGMIWKYTEPGAMPRERHDKVYTASGNDQDGEPGLPLSDKFDYLIVNE